MAKIASSPNRHERTLSRYNNPDASEELIDHILKAYREKEYMINNDIDYQKNNLEYDLRSTEWICQKVKDNKIYAQNLYAAMCNREFIKKEVFNILKNETWGCSWRSAGGIIADMREEGDYIDWYCSGIREMYDGGYVPEGEVTDEVRQDLSKLGWLVADTEY